MTYELTLVDTPFGPGHALARNGRLCAFGLAGTPPRASSPLSRLDALAPRRVPDAAGSATALRAYFRGDLAAVDRLEVDPDGTEFQLRVWAGLRRIPAAETTSYGALARSLGLPTSACRAVGAANGANPIWIVVPCHRVMGASGALTGYAGGLDVKRWLLDHERAAAGAQRALFETAPSPGLQAG
jgi:methylated-DNA-[protein]-cysteine S-methyltransferase